MAYEFKRVIEELKQEDNRQQRRDQNLVAQLDTRTEVIETVGLQPASDSHSKKVHTKCFYLLKSYNKKIFYFIQI